MPFVQGKCESCGGILAVDPSLKAANCPFCGTAYVVQDSINYYNTTIKVETMHADVVNVSDETTSEGRIKAADAYMKLGKFAQAEADYRKATELTPQNYKGWLGLIESRTHNYRLRIKSAKELKTLDEYAKPVRMFAPKESCADILKKFEAYRKGEIEKNTNEINTYNKAIAEQSECWRNLKTQEESLQSILDQKQDRLSHLNNQISLYEKGNRNGTCVLWILILFGVGIVGLFVNIIIGILHLLASGIPGFILIKGILKNKHNKKERDVLSKEETILWRDIDTVKRQKVSYNTAIQTNQKYLKAYN